MFWWPSTFYKSIFLSVTEKIAVPVHIVRAMCIVVPAQVNSGAA